MAKQGSGYSGTRYDLIIAARGVAESVRERVRLTDVDLRQCHQAMSSARTNRTRWGLKAAQTTRRGHRASLPWHNRPCVTATADLV